MEKKHKEEFQTHRLLKNHLFHWKEIVIGGNLNAYIYANEKSSYIILFTQIVFLILSKLLLMKLLISTLLKLGLSTESF